MEGDGKKRRSTMSQPDPSGLHKRLSTSPKTGPRGLRKCVRNNPENDSSNSEADNAKNQENVVPIELDVKADKGTSDRDETVHVQGKSISTK